jgi:methionyl-tRNA formyltransferase
MSRLAFLGSPDAAVPALQALVSAGHDVAVVVSQPDKRRGRRAAPSPSPVKRAALDCGLRVTDQLSDVLSASVELGIVVAYGRIVPRRVLDELEMLNAHFSLLPRWRGAAPVERAILAGDRETGVCIMRLEEGLDTGPVLGHRCLAIDDAGREHASALTARLAELAATMLVDVLDGGVATLPRGDPQIGEVTYAPKIEMDELRLDFSRGVSELERLVRLDRAWTTFRGTRLLVLDAKKHLSVEHASPGSLQGTSVEAADGALELIVLQPAGRRPLPAAQWVRGTRPRPGERLGD